MLIQEKASDLVSVGTSLEYASSFV